MQAIDIILENSQPLAPKPTDTEPVLPELDGIRAVLFDVYGTLFISASGDISLTSGASRGDAAEQACQQAGLMLTTAVGDDVVAALHAEIKRQHAESDFEFPEVDIHEVWRSALKTLLEQGYIDYTLKDHEIEQLAIEYETRVNPVWPMPGLSDCLASLHAAGLPLGIVSNAQSFTRELFPALGGGPLDELGFDAALCVWSYEERKAKPSQWMYEKVSRVLTERGIAPDTVLYVGNDMRNDVAPAAAVGFRTVLFAGDARSLRLREGDPLVEGVQPTAVVTDLRQILTILRLAPPQL
ncbi:HAD family hydrolase [Aeoliella mucimassa]|uniref:Phosphoglycolate phosphatase n=1 Tax=Aeoliella mucimassa TaxID=2527972 RepID=A0A518AUP0_9BACT|nr:HAD family hydrolase [Aeoliella mucimassa]QDU58440.1 Phosphoglycolate phosphatase [Aeoliella mucimassa]